MYIKYFYVNYEIIYSKLAFYKLQLYFFATTYKVHRMWYMEVHLKELFSIDCGSSNLLNDDQMREKNIIWMCHEVEQTFSFFKSRFKYLNHSGEGSQ